VLSPRRALQICKKHYCHFASLGALSASNDNACLIHITKGLIPHRSCSVTKWLQKEHTQSSSMALTSQGENGFEEAMHGLPSENPAHKSTRPNPMFKEVAEETVAGLLTPAVN